MPRSQGFFQLLVGKNNKDESVISFFELVYPTENGPAFELFDLAKDPLEKHNLAAAKPEVVEKLQSRVVLKLLGAGEKQELSEEDRELLRSLGYTE